MPLIHHPDLGRELEVSDKAAKILTTNPRRPWRHGALPKPTAIPETSPSGDHEPVPEEED